MTMTVGLRLKEERERLGCSQTEFARLTGVHRNTLARYESGDREPDPAFLTKASSIGADYGYLLSGQRSTPESLYPIAAARVLPWIAARANLSGAAVLALLDLAAEEEALLWGPTNPGAFTPDWSSLIDALFENGPMLAQAFKEIGTVAGSNGWKLECGRHAQAAMMVYGVLKELGKVDARFLENVVKLARGAGT